MPETPRSIHAYEKVGVVASRHVPSWLAVTIALGCGAVSATQSRINGELSRRLDDGFVAAALSFASGLVILIVVLILSPAGRRGMNRVGSALRHQQLPLVYLLGGCAGAVFVLSQTLTVSVLGVALFTVASVTGQTLAGLVIDRTGFAAESKRLLSRQRILGAMLVLAAVTWAVSSQVRTETPVWMLLLPFFGGLGTGWQYAVNGRVRFVADSAVAATFISFLAGTLVLAAVVLIRTVAFGWPMGFPTEPWLYSGGLLGCILIGTTVLLVRTTGVLLLGLGLVSGQLLTALVLDVFWPSATTSLGYSTGLAVVLAIVGVTVASIRRRPA